MKYHPLVKLIAIVLCAASLLGMVACGLGMFVLTEQDLYHKTVDQAMTNEQRDSAQEYAQLQALRYASVHLGGCSPELRERFYSTSWIHGFFAPENYGFLMLDSEGNPVTGIHGEMKDTATVYTVPVSGQYIHVVSETPVSARFPEPTQPPLVITEQILPADEPGVYDSLPQGQDFSAEAYSIHVRYADNGEEGRDCTYPIGTLTRDENGKVVFSASEPWVLEDVGDGDPIIYICFRDASGNLLFEASDYNGVGKAYYEPGGMIVFVSALVSELNIPEEASDLEDNTICQVEFYNAEDPNTVSFTVYSDENLGTLWYDEEGTLMLSIRSIQDSGVRSSGTIAGGEVSGLAVYNSHGAEILRHDNPGTVSIDPETLGLRYQSQPPVTGEPEALSETTADEPAQDTKEAPEEASQETEAETVPPTVPETIPETIHVTVPETIPETMPAETEPIMLGGRLLTDYEYNHTTYFSSEHGEDMYVEYVYTPLPEYTVEVYFSQELQNHEMVNLMVTLRELRDFLLPVLGICAVAFLLLAVYLCFAAGRGPETGEVRPGGLNRLPLDLYFLGTVALVTGLLLLIVESFPYLLRQSVAVGCGIGGGLGYLCSLAIVGFLFALITQWKAPGFFWWNHSICGKCLGLCWKALKWNKNWLFATGIPGGIRLAVWLWKQIARLVVSFLQRLGKLVRRFMELLPMTWQWMVVLFLLILFITVAAAAGSGLLMLLCMAAAVALALYVSHCFGGLLESTKRMRQGELDHKIDSRLLVGCFYDFAQELNQLADVAVVAAQKQLKSERMKSELITNVSHDIKTPLTSIINYVDLLQKPHSQEEEEIYLEVLERQSLSLKKLIEDLMDMSKASTGNMAVEPMVLDGVEAVNQALGEYADKLEKAMVLPVFRHSEASALMVADGRLTWRVLGNLLNNAVKYAMPGTRLYIDLMVVGSEVVVSLKNISRDELNVGSEELMERFVRGDDSRNTEGSGLGLNIAKSLMELQKGRLELLVDGDLFKVTLIFPAA